MQYYKNYIEEDLNFGKLEFIDNIFYVNKEEVLNNRAFINDIVCGNKRKTHKKYNWHFVFRFKNKIWIY